LHLETSHDHDTDREFSAGQIWQSQLEGKIYSSLFSWR